ncbi:MAG: YqiJ family protein [Desulfobacteraceae bacterium]|nr:YqiJ family protein [Desulfobacteraceae bacterium]
MVDFMLQSQNLPFMISLTIMIMIACLEGVTTMIGMGLSHMIDSFIPDCHIHMHGHLDSPDISSPGILTKTFGWFRIGQVPFLIILIAFLTVFGLIGLFVQSMAVKLTGLFLPVIIASGITLPITLPIVRVVTGITAKIMPKDETEAITEKSFIGRVAVITLGRATKNNSAQAKFKDKFGTAHYLMVEPDMDDEEFNQGDQVLIVSQTSSGFKAIGNSIGALQDMD